GCRRALPREPGAGAGDAQEGARRDEDARPPRGAAGLGDSRRPARRFAAPALLHLVCELSRDLARGAVEVTPSRAARPRRVLETRRGMTILDSQAFDRLRRGLARLRELLSHALAESCGQRIDLVGCRRRHAW